jgi:endonuclease/exonuclease/phosphatase family metal-dependent hydrolase
MEVRLPPVPEPLDRAILRVRVTLPGTGQAPILISNVHLPSNRQRGREGGAAQRAAELPVAVGPDPETGQPADVALGDFNEDPDGPCGITLTGWGWVDAALADGQDDVPSNARGTKRGDQVWLAPHAAGRLERYFSIEAARLAVAAGSLDSQGKTFLSDHLPICVDLAWPPSR